MSDERFCTRVLSIVEAIDRASTPDVVLEVYAKALAEIGADYIGVLFLPRPKERLENVCLAWRVPEDWRALYAGNNFCQRDPAVRQCRRSVLPFDWASAPYDPETEPHMKEVMDRAHDFNIDKGISVPIPSTSGIIGAVWVAGPEFEDREVHKPVLHMLALHVFHRLERLIGRRLEKSVCLTDREREVLAWASEGKTAWEIGCILGLSQRTVEWHFRQACKKLGAKNRFQAIALMGDARGAFDPVNQSPPVGRGRSD
jgi:DNA-binding CsgD family transcriptional regulator